MRGRRSPPDPAARPSSEETKISIVMRAMLAPGILAYAPPAMASRTRSDRHRHAVDETAGCADCG
jgi:hypothetical protein